MDRSKHPFRPPSTPWKLPASGRIAPGLAIAALVTAAIAAPVEASRERRGDPRQITPGLDTELILEDVAFLKHHPDKLYRRRGAQAFTSGQYTLALGYFERAARYADKPSQAAIAEIHFLGRGVEVDRARGYAWMDLAAERGYPRFLAMRERYWAELDAGEQARTVEIGREIYARYADEVAKPRLAPILRRGRNEVTGSRLGSVGNLNVEITDSSGMTRTIRGDHYYDRRLWDPEYYWEWQDEVYSAPPRGRVDVLPLRSTGPGDRGGD